MHIYAVIIFLSPLLNVRTDITMEKSLCLPDIDNCMYVRRKEDTFIIWDQLLLNKGTTMTRLDKSGKEIIVLHVLVNPFLLSALKTVWQDNRSLLTRICLELPVHMNFANEVFLEKAAFFPVYLKGEEDF